MPQRNFRSGAQILDRVQGSGFRVQCSKLGRHIATLMLTETQPTTDLCAKYNLTWSKFSVSCSGQNFYLNPNLKMGVFDFLSSFLCRCLFRSLCFFLFLSHISTFLLTVEVALAIVSLILSPFLPISSYCVLIPVTSSSVLFFVSRHFVPLNLQFIFAVKLKPFHIWRSSRLTSLLCALFQLYSPAISNLLPQRMYSESLGLSLLLLF